ncbi:MAG: glycosyltransferase [Desulfovibrio sp.]|nr:glycosyltransferase [Desulfovibrio sp.]
MNIAIASSQICYFRGGAERASLRLAHEMRSRGHAVHILTVTGRYSPVYPIDPRLSVHFFPGIFFHRKLEAIALGPALLQEQRIDVLVSLESDWKHAMWYACSERAQIPFVYSERITPTYVEDNWSRDERLFVLEKAAAIHELLPCYLKYIPEHLRSKTFILPNAVPETVAAQAPERSPKPPILLYLGRLTLQKRPALLLQAFGLLAEEFPHWRLRMAGWGAQQEHLESLAHSLGLAERVVIGEAAKDTRLEYQQASVYCLPTLFEGFPNAVLEAMSAGLPVVGIADCPAMTAIIRHGVTGLLADSPTPQALAATLRPLLTSEKARRRMGREAWRQCQLEYAGKRIFDAWDARLCKIVEAFSTKKERSSCRNIQETDTCTPPIVT